MYREGESLSRFSQFPILRTFLRNSIQLLRGLIIIYRSKSHTH